VIYLKIDLFETEALLLSPGFSGNSAVLYPCILNFWTDYLICYERRAVGCHTQSDASKEHCLKKLKKYIFGDL
jgi:hypothetical protein